jgi:hypothetical protein
MCARLRRMGMSKLRAYATLIASVSVAVTACASPAVSAAGRLSSATSDVSASRFSANVAACEQADLHTRLTPQFVASGAPWDGLRVIVEASRECTLPAAAIFVATEPVRLSELDPGRSDHSAPPAPNRLVSPGHPVALSIMWAGGTRDTPRILTSLHVGDTVVALGHLLYWEHGPISVSVPWRVEDQPHTGTTSPAETTSPAIPAAVQAVIARTQTDSVDGTRFVTQWVRTTAGHYAALLRQPRPQQPNAVIYVVQSIGDFILRAPTSGGDHVTPPAGTVEIADVMADGARTAGSKTGFSLTHPPIDLRGLGAVHTFKAGD